jgi:hypothetical protein
VCFIFWGRLAAPIIVHVLLDKVLDAMVRDPVLRNMFEVNRGSAVDQHKRAEWEDHVFQLAYMNAEPIDRPKMGVLNFSSDPNGVLRYHISFGFPQKAHDER